MFRGQPKPAPCPQTPQAVGRRFPGSLESDLRRWAIEQAVAARTYDCSHVQLIDAAEAIYNFALGSVHVIDPGKPSE